jgi:hypothetical protein
LAFAILLAAPALAGVPIDGHLDSAYGPALVTQTTQTSTNDNPCGFGGPTRSSSRPAPSWTPFMASSRTACSICSWPEKRDVVPGEFQHQHQLHVFIDSRPGGQNALRATTPTTT